VVHQKLVTDLGHNQPDVDPALCRRSQRGHQRLIGHKVGVGDRNRMLRGVKQRHEQLQIVVVLESGAARQHLAQ
jgi:hypothetical protein